MTDPITLTRVEKHQLIRFGHNVIAAHVAQIHATIRKHEVSGVSAFLRASGAALTPAYDIPNRHSVRVEKLPDRDIHCRLSQRVRASVAMISGYSSGKNSLARGIRRTPVTCGRRLARYSGFERAKMVSAAPQTMRVGTLHCF